MYSDIEEVINAIKEVKEIEAPDVDPNDEILNSHEVIFHLTDREQYAVNKLSSFLQDIEINEEELTFNLSKRDGEKLHDAGATIKLSGNYNEGHNTFYVEMQIEAEGKGFQGDDFHKIIVERPDIEFIDS